MSKPQRFFRFLWRINAVLILIATGAVVIGAAAIVVQETRRTVASKEKAAPLSPVADQSTDRNLHLGRSWLVHGTGILRTDLVLTGDSDKFSSGGGSETRNILFIDPDQKTGRWLLPDNKHAIGETSDVTVPHESEEQRTIASAAVVRPAEEPSATGNLILFDPAGKKVVEISKGVTEIHVASLSGNDIVLLYERNSHLVRASFDRESLEKHTETEIEVPKVK